MTSAFDDRIVRVGISFENDTLVFQDLDIRASGFKYATATSNQATIRISNMTREHRNQLLTVASPYPTKQFPNRSPAFVTLDVGRKSYGTFRLFEGYCIAGIATPPPDIGIVLTSLTQNLQASIMSEISFGPQTDLKVIAQEIAKRNNLTLSFSASPSSVGSFAYTGSNRDLINKLQIVSGGLVYVDNDTLVVTDRYGYRNDAKTITINQETGMVGVPQPTEWGASVQTLVKPDIQLGDRVSLQSKINPFLNGSDYAINTIGFEIANRSTPFFYNMLLKNNAFLTGTS